MKNEYLNNELIDNPNAEEGHELADAQLDKVAGGAKLPHPGSEGACPNSPDGGDHDWYLANTWNDGRGTGQIWQCRRCNAEYKRFLSGQGMPQNPSRRPHAAI